MPNNIDLIRRELESLGYETSSLESPQGEVVAFLYTIESGSLRGEQVHLGVSMQGSEMYPEYPPHWIHLTPPVDDGKGGSVISYTDSNGQTWGALSRPPGEIWDQLPTKHMFSYLNEHLRRFWDSV